MAVEGGLSDAERQVRDAFPAGRLVKFEAGYAEDDDPARGEGWGPERQIRAEILAALLSDIREMESGQIGGVCIERARIIGKLKLSDATFKHSLQLHHCYVADGIDLSGATIWMLDLEGCHVGAISLRGARIDGAFSFKGAVLNRAVLCDEGFRALGQVNLVGASFADSASFDNATFGDSASFDNATFGDSASFKSATFKSATFGNYTSFKGAVFGDCTLLDGTRFGNYTSFESAIFGDSVSFESAIFGDSVSFGSATFGDFTSLKGATFGESAHFLSATFGNHTSLDGATFGVTFGDPMHFESATFGDSASFDNATFGDSASFRKTTFGKSTRFGKAIFGDSVSFESAIFGDSSYFDSATFGNYTSLDGATFGVTFGDPMHFESATFGDSASFDNATFGDSASFRKTTFGKSTRFGKATFGDSAYFESAIFGDSASFDSITFGDRAFLNGANFGDRASFLSATFGDAAVLRVSGSNFITFGRLKMGRGGVIRATCSLLDMFGATFPYGVTLLAREADVAINQVSFGEASIMAAFGPSKRADEPDMPGFTGPRLPWAPRLLSMQGCDVTYLTLNAMDLRPCWFQGAYNLELLRIGGGAVFAQQPPARLWTRRLVLAEEHVWRAIYEPRRRSRGWYPNECRGREGSTPSRQPKERRSSTARTAAGTVELVYRALRKGLEDVKDEPGAADFYYGEMEMRRRAAPPRSVERALLFVYWLLAGYGLRASRALAALLVVLALTTVGFVAVGFASSTTTAYQQVIGPSGTTSYRPVEIRGAPPGWTEAVTYSVQSTTSLLSAPTDEPLTESGRVIEIVLRLLGPVLLGLAVLAVRGRVKR